MLTTTADFFFAIAEKQGTVTTKKILNGLFIAY